GTDTITVNVTVQSVNDAPSFTKGDDQTVLEDAGAQTVAGWATAISKGPANESGQVLTFNVSTNNNALFSALPTIDETTGDLTYTPAANANGSAIVTVSLSDNGGGTDTSADQTFTITVTAVNDVPSFAKGANQTVLEDAGAQTVAGWATAISKGPSDEAAQTLAFNVTGNTNAALFSAGPAIASNGTLTFTPAANANGTATITITLSDNGGTANGGADTSAAQTFSITVTAVNDVPSFTKGADQSAIVGSGAKSVAGWATAIAKGPANESSQVVDFIVSNDNTAIFAVQPAVSPTGTLTYTPSAATLGVATVTVRIHDNGGTANGGVDTSAAQTFTITITAAPPLGPLNFSLGVFRNGQFDLDENRNGIWNGSPPDRRTIFGTTGDTPVVGDWNGDGKDEIGTFRAGVWRLDLNDNGVWDGPAADRQCTYGQTGDRPIVGDWNGDGKDEIGVVRGTTWILDLNANGVMNASPTDRRFTYGNVGDIPVAGDWNGDRKDEVGVFRSGGQWLLDRNANFRWDGNTLDRYTVYGLTGDTPVIGDWNRDGKDEIGIVRRAVWDLDKNGNFKWDGTAIDYRQTYGYPTDKPAVRVP
ncbi:MAG: Ig-like domain-containing protein, partial [Planctomycetota bacterium]